MDVSITLSLIDSIIGADATEIDSSWNDDYVLSVCIMIYSELER